MGVHPRGHEQAARCCSFLFCACTPHLPGRHSRRAELASALEAEDLDPSRFRYQRECTAWVKVR